MAVGRFDTFEIKLRPPSTDGISGSVTADAFATRCGVLIYHHRDGSTTRELRHPDDVFDPASMESLKRKSVTDNHPTSAVINTKNARFQTVGFTGDIVERADDKMRVPITIFDEAMIKKMSVGDDGRKPKTQLSCGYLCDTIEESGTHNGERYDHRQINIRYNHLAIVERGRAGDSIRVRMDSESAYADGLDYVCYFEGDANDPGKQSRKSENPTMIIIKRDAKKIGDHRFDSFEVEVEDGSKAAVQSVLSKLDAAYDRLDDQHSQSEKITGERDSLKSEVENLKTKFDEASKGPSQKDMQTAVREYSLVSSVARHLKVNVADDMSVADIRRAVVASKAGDLKKDASDDYIVGRYDTIYDGLKDELDNLDSLKDLGSVTSDKGKRRVDAGHIKKESPRDRMVKKMADASKHKDEK